MASYLESVDELKISVKDRRKILHENAAALFRIPIPEAALPSGR